MHLDSHSFHRKVIIPWYDSNRVCLITCAVMLLAFGFGVIGVFAAYENPDYRRYAWVPITLTALSGGVAVSLGARLFRRKFRR